MRLVIFFICVLFLILGGCSRSSSSSSGSPLKGEYIIRKHDESLLTVERIHYQKRAAYDWEEGIHLNYPRITKDFFRCQGSSLNPVRVLQREKEIIRYYDCEGPQKHSLPLREQKEFIYPILIDLLNDIQYKSGKRVVITCGHCCPDHGLYINGGTANQFSKHMLGAEVDFYVQGMEENPQQVIDWILLFFVEQSKYHGLIEFQKFKRYEKEDRNVLIPAWYNKEIFVKLVKKNEGRDYDNRHPYPYISIQVRYDWDLNEKVVYSWDRAFHNFHRW